MPILSLFEKTIGRYLSFVTTTISGAVGAVFLLSLMALATVAALSTAKDRGASYADILAYNLQAPLAFLDTESAQITLESVASITDVQAIEVKNPDGSLFIAVGSIPANSQIEDSLFFPAYHVASSDILIGGEPLGTVSVLVSLGPVYADARAVSIGAFSIWLAALFLSIPLTRTLNNRVTVPLANISSLMTRSASEETFEERIAIERDDELGNVASALNNLLDRVADREARLSSFIDELTAARDDAESSTRAKTSFLANMSHEIRTPMNGVIGLMDLVKLEGLSDQQTIWLDSMKKSADALLTVIDDILDFTKIEAGHLEITPVDFDLRPCVESVLYLFSEQASTKNIALNLHIDDSVPAVLHADQGRVRQILTNLLSNAVKFTPQGTISIYITTVPGAELGSCRFTITDTGIGIPEDEYDKVFTRFQQVDQGLTRRYGGSGLGLSICRQLLSLMGGSIGFSSDLGYGSRFWFDFPIKRGASTGLPAQSDRPTTELARPDSSAVSDGSESLSVLIAEDSEVNQFIILELLKQCGVSGVVVENGAKAVEALAKQRYDLILMDVSMPVMDGLEATQRIRSQESTTDQRATIIGLSAHAMTDDIARAMDAGMDSYITKPVSLTDLQEALQTLPQPNGGT